METFCFLTVGWKKRCGTRVEGPLKLRLEGEGWVASVRVTEEEMLSKVWRNARRFARWGRGKAGHHVTLGLAAVLHGWSTPVARLRAQGVMGRAWGRESPQNTGTQDEDESPTKANAAE